MVPLVPPASGLAGGFCFLVSCAKVKGNRRGPFRVWEGERGRLPGGKEKRARRSALGWTRPFR